MRTTLLILAALAGAFGCARRQPDLPPAPLSAAHDDVMHLAGACPAGPNCRVMPKLPDAQQHVGHAPADCPNGPNSPNCPNKPKPNPPGPYVPPRPEPPAPIIPDDPLSLALIAILIAGVFGGIGYLIRSKQSEG